MGSPQTEALNYVVGSPPLNWQAPPVTLTNPNWPRPRAPLACFSEQLVEPSCHCIRVGQNYPLSKATPYRQTATKNTATLTCVNSSYSPTAAGFLPRLGRSQTERLAKGAVCRCCVLTPLASTVPIQVSNCTPCGLCSSPSAGETYMVGGPLRCLMLSKTGFLDTRSWSYLLAPRLCLSRVPPLASNSVTEGLAQ